MAKAKWTDWITHTPGQEVPPGFEITVETKNMHGRLHVASGVTSRETVGHGCWHAKDHRGQYTMITRYKLRVIEDEAKDDARVIRKAQRACIETRTAPLRRCRERGRYIWKTQYGGTD